MISATGTRRGPQRWTEADIFGVKGALRRIDDGTTPKSFGLKPLIAKALLSFVGVAVLAATAHAEDCLAAPNSPAREGTRWYYRLDLATQHKCWYMRAPDEPAQQAAVSAKITPAAPIPIPRPRPLAASAAPPLTLGDTDRSLSSSEAIAAKPSSTPPVSKATAEIPSSIPEESTSQQADTSLAAPAPNATPLLGAATDETTSAISEAYQTAPSRQTNAAAITPAPEIATTGETGSPTSDITAPKQEATSSEPNGQVAESGPTVAPEIIAPIDDAAPSSIPKDTASQLSTSSDFRPNGAEPGPDVSVAQSHAPLTGTTNNTDPIPFDAPIELSDGRQRTSLSDEPINNAGMRVRPLHLILAFVVMTVVMSYYIIFRCFLGGGSTQSDGHQVDGDDGLDDRYNNPEFYRKLRERAVPEKS
jgi:hypothetical protein